MFKEINQTYTI